MSDWLDSDAEKEQRRQAVEFAQNYAVFVEDPRAKALLEQWKSASLHKRTPVDAPIQTYAADEAIRAFIAGIVSQVEIAKNEDF